MRAYLATDPLTLVIPTSGHGPLLFLEWIAEQQKPVTVSVEREVEGEEPVLRVRLNKGKRGEYGAFLEYINANL